MHSIAKAAGKMDQTGPHTWPSYLLCAATLIVMGIAGVDAWVIVAAGLVWIGSIWILTLRPPPPQMVPQQDPFRTDKMGELIEFSGTPILLVDHGRISVANRAARKVLGKHIVGQDMRVAFRHPEAIRLLDKQNGGFTQIVGLVRRRDVWRMNRKVLSDHLSVVELLNQTAEVDIARAHTDFVANASHELRTPLASIIGYVETLQDSDTKVAETTKQKFLSTILAEANRLQSLVSDLMSLSRIEAEKHEQPRERVDLKPLIQTASRDAAGLERSPRLTFDLADDLVVLGDPRQLEQLVRNLVDNALKYGGPDSGVTISLSRTDNEEALIAVADQGEGIPAEHIPHLTRRFYRTDPGRSRASGGTGLGLAIVKHIVERHRGRLDIASQQGQGTVVSARIPLVDGKAS